MSKSDTFENDFLKLIFNGTPIANIADNAASGPLANLYISLHIGDPGEAGDQTTNEISYTGYARVPVARSGSGFTVTGSAVNPVSNIDFGVMTGGAGGTADYFGIGTDLTGAGRLLYSGNIVPTISVVNGVIPRLTTASSVTED